MKRFLKFLVFLLSTMIGVALMLYFYASVNWWFAFLGISFLAVAACIATEDPEDNRRYDPRDRR